jgi:hypothetical protein
LVEYFIQNAAALFFSKKKFDGATLVMLLQINLIIGAAPADSSNCFFEPNNQLIRLIENLP